MALELQNNRLINEAHICAHSRSTRPVSQSGKSRDCTRSTSTRLGDFVFEEEGDYHEFLLEVLTQAQEHEKQAEMSEPVHPQSMTPALMSDTRRLAA